MVDNIWRFSRPDGSPDPLHKNDNVQIPVVLYSLLDINGPLGLKMRLMVSNRRAAARFARTFGAGGPQGEEAQGYSSAGAARSGKASGRSSSNGQKSRKEEYRSAEELEREARLATARKTLGVAKGAIGGADHRRLQGAGAHPPPRQGCQPGAGGKRVFGAEDEGDQLSLRGAQAPVERAGYRGDESGMSRITNTSTVSSTKRRLAILSMAVCVALSGAFAASGCGVRSGMERVDEAKQAKKQVEKQQRKLEKDLKKGQKKLPGQ